MKCSLSDYISKQFNDFLTFEKNAAWWFMTLIYEVDYKDKLKHWNSISLQYSKFTNYKFKLDISIYLYQI